MKREKWRFPHSAKSLAEAAAKKAEHHTARHTFWSQKKADVLQKIKDTGLKVDESQVEDMLMSSNYGRNPTVTVDQSLLRDMTECVAKIREHSDKVRAYQGWQQVLADQGDTVLSLNHDDWLYFFGK